MVDDDDDMAADWAAALGEQAADEEAAAGGGDDMEIDMAAALEQQAAEEAKPQPAPRPEPASLGEAIMGDDASRVEAVYDIPVEIIAVLGTAAMPIAQILKLGRGAVVELDRIIGEPIEIHANNRLVARGEVVVVEDRLGVQITEVIRSI